MDTKDTIITTALSLFNEQGYGSVSMKQIADLMGVDRRNITYHYNKDSLLAAITDQMWGQLNDVRSQKRDFPSFENLDKEVRLYNQLQRAYAFIFKDLNVIEHPIIHDQFRAFSEIMIADCQQAVAFAIQQGNMRPETIPGSYYALCTAVWTVSFSWLHMDSLHSVGQLDHVRKLIWSLIVPYFTDKGIQSFKSFYGPDFFDDLGAPFSVQVKTLLF